MKIDTKSLTTACARIVPLSQKRTTLPILNHLRIESKGSLLEISASNQISHQLVKVPCEGELSPVCVQAKMFSQLVSNGNGSVELANLEGSLSVKSGWSSKLPVLDASEFPAIPSDLKGVGVSIPDLTEGISGVAWAAMAPKEAETQSRHALSSVLVDLKPKSMMVCAVDGKKACMMNRALICSPFRAIIPIEYVEDIVWALKQKDATLWASDKAIGVIHGGGSFHCQLREDEYPNILNAIPPDCDPIAVLDREQLISHCQNCAVVDPERDDIIMGGKVYLTSSPGKVVVSSVATSGAKYEAEMEGGLRDMRSGYRLIQMVPGLKACTLDKVAIMQADEKAWTSWRHGDFVSVIAGLRLE